jgi:hypothetical protein
VSKALMKKIRSEAAAHDLRAAEMLRVGVRLLEIADDCRQAARALDGKRGRGRPRKVTGPWNGGSRI